MTIHQSALKIVRVKKARLTDGGTAMELVADAFNEVTREHIRLIIPNIALDRMVLAYEEEEPSLFGLCEAYTRSYYVSFPLEQDKSDHALFRIKEKENKHESN